MLTLKEQLIASRMNKFFDKFGKIPTPKCFKCNQPVEVFDVTFDPEKDAMVFTCKCHGDQEKAIFNFAKVMGFDTCVVQNAFYAKTQLLDGEKVIIL